MDMLTVEKIDLLLENPDLTPAQRNTLIALKAMPDSWRLNALMNPEADKNAHIEEAEFTEVKKDVEATIATE